MANKKNTEQIYLKIIHEVITKIKDEFNFDGLSEDTISMLENVKKILIFRDGRKN
jgi:hypothetical protein